KSTCSSHSAVNNAETKATQGLATTGIGSVCCARHKIKLPSSVGDLQKRERYINMDYVFFSAMRNTAIKVFNVSYDVACQWSIHLWERMKTLPLPMHFPYNDRKVTTLVPKFHLPAHIAQCQWKYSLNYTKGVGQTDGEALEQGWSTLNVVASSTKAMGPSHRRDMLEDLIGDSNWKKVIGPGESILQKIIEVVPEQNDYLNDLWEFEKSLSEHYGIQLSKWQADFEAWEKDRLSYQNPFEVRSHAITQASVRLQLAAEEANLSGMVPIHSEITPDVLIATGIDLEEQHNGLMNRIENWTDVQTLYIPCMVSLRTKATCDAKATPKPENFCLWLPSALQHQVPCDVKLEEIEWKLHIGQAYDALEELRQVLRSRSYMLCFKDWFLRGQGANTWARNTLKLVDARIDASATKYRVAYSTLSALSPLLGKVGWQHAFCCLQDDDIRSMTEGTEDRPSEGQRRLSWIWITCKYSSGDKDREQALQDAIQIEWCRAKARANCWAEEVELLVEEQHHILQIFRWCLKWWMEKQASFETGDPALKEGLNAYALQQAALRQDLANHFEQVWR
ncbi:hypothetical protein OG21DRAFT_1386139, partial [Imleria badia]